MAEAVAAALEGVGGIPQALRHRDGRRLGDHAGDHCRLSARVELHRFLAAHHYGVKPDMVILAKALSGGLVPVSAKIFSGMLKERGWYFSSFQASAE